MDSIISINTNCDDLERQAVELQEYANSFARIGNLILSKKLAYISYNITRNQTEIRKKAYLELDEQVKQANQSSVNILNAALAGITIGQKT